MTFESILNILKENIYIVAGVAIVLIVLIFLYIRSAQKRRLRNQFDALEVKYNELVSIPILFKINKATSLAKINPDEETEVMECKALFDEINKNQETITQVMADLEDAIAYNKVKDSRGYLVELDELVNKSLLNTHTLNKRLEVLLEQETNQRLEITELKETFRELKQETNSKASLLRDAYDALDEQIHSVEHLFSVFEEWMYASDFMKAREVTEEVKGELSLLKLRLDEIPKLYEIAKGHIPSLLDEVSRLYQGVIQDGVYVEHLEVPKNIGVLSDVLRDDLIVLAQGDVEKAKSSLLEIHKRLETIATQIQKENASHREVTNLSETVFASISELKEECVKVVDQAPRVERRYGFNGFVDQAQSFETSIADFDEVAQKISRMIHEEKIPASTVILSLQELGQDVQILKQEFTEFVEKMDQANADEIRANNQLMKLYLIINDVQVRIHRRFLPIISEKYHDDVLTAVEYTHRIATMLEDDAVDVAVLNATVDEAIDFTYKLHNNVNNLVGAVDMCENAIVYANKFRAFVPDIDTELTRAELAFQSGEYTQALATVINAVDRYRPDSSYEEMIRNNAKSAR